MACRARGWRGSLCSAVIPAVDVAVALVNRAVTRGFGATMLPGLALRDGVPANLRTLVVVPTLLTTPESIETQIERLEVHYLAAAHGEVHFALLSDWTDAATETTDGDAALLRIATDGIARLNRVHGPAAAGQRFYLFHRHRVWSEGQRRWMGWERKRGKLHELNRLLRGAADTTFIGRPRSTAAGRRRTFAMSSRSMPTRGCRVRPCERLIGKMAHPLNRPLFDRATGRVVEGYAVLQPRVTPSLPIGREGSLFQRVFSSIDRHRSLRCRRVRRVPGSVRRRLVCRQGHLRRRRVRGRAGRSGAGRLACSVTICSRGLRARRTGLGHRGGRRVSLALRRRRRTQPSLGTRRLAVAAVDTGTRRRCRAQWARQRRQRPIAADRPLENARQPAPVVVRASLRSCADRRLVVAARCRSAVDSVRADDRRIAGTASRARGDRAAATRAPRAQSLARARVGPVAGGRCRSHCSSPFSRIKPG